MEFVIDTSYNFISPYSVCMLLSFLISFSISSILLLKENVNRTLSFCSGMLNCMLSLYFGSLYSAIFYHQDKRIGFSSIGGFIGVLTGTLVLSILFKEYRKSLFKAFSSVIPLLYSISKLGCFFAGCCEGIKYDKIFNVTYLGDVAHVTNIRLFPVQFVESLLFFILFLIVFYFIYIKKIDFKICFFINLVTCSFLKFLLDFLRNSHDGEILSKNQIACVLIIFIYFLILAVNKIRKRIK